jgi:hypothetical protein
MKKNLSRIPMLLSLVMVLGGFSTVNQAQTVKETEIKTQQGKEPICFVQKKDGTIQHYSSLKMVTGIFTSPYLLADGNIKIKAADIKAYQDAEHYAISQKYLENGHQSKVAIDALPGFAVRIISGHISVFCKKYFNGAKAIDELFIQSGEDGKILPYSPELVLEMVKDHQDILKILNSKDNKTLTERLLAVAEIYNQQHLLTKN